MRGSTGNLIPPSKMAIKEKIPRLVKAPLDSNIALMTVGDINISGDAVGRSEVSQGGLRCKKMRVSRT